MTTVGKLMMVGVDDYPDRICDCCDERIEGKVHYHWEEKDFDLCCNCIEKLYQDMFEPALKDDLHNKKEKIPKNIKWKIWRRDNFTCQYCGIKDDLSIDHIFRESKGGKLIDENLVTSCRKCNSKKNNRTPEEAGMKLITDPRK